MSKKNWYKLLISLLLPQLAGGAGALFTMSEIPTWYATLVKPALNPPSWVFGPVWTTLFLLMGTALFLVWKRTSEKRPLNVFALQMVLNTLWSIVFFGLHSPVGAVIVIVFLWLAIVWTMYEFYRVSRAAAWLLVPYLLWVSFASYLNFSIWLLN